LVLMSHLLIVKHFTGSQDLQCFAHMDIFL
jgi:hypothetical protein